MLPLHQRREFLGNSVVRFPKRKPWDLNPQRVSSRSRFQDGVLIQPDDFRCTFVFKLRELESNQRPPGSEPSVATNSNYLAVFFFNPTWIFSCPHFPAKTSHLCLVGSGYSFRTFASNWILSAATCPQRSVDYHAIDN